MLGVTTVLYMRQTLLDVRWWQAVGVAGVLMAVFARELALPANAYWLFFARYVVGATLATVVLARLLPAHLLSEMPEILFRTGILRQPAAEPRRARAKAT